MSADFDGHAEALRRYAEPATGDDLTVGEFSAPAATLMPDGHEGMDEAEVDFEFHLMESETTTRRREASGGGKGDVKDNLLGRVPAWG